MAELGHLILIVDDERPIRELLRGTLESLDYRTMLASNGEEALIRVGEDRPDLVLTDVMMPLLGGAELCRRLKADPATAAMPVLLMSAADGALQDASSGADAFIRKPFDLDEVEALIANYLPLT